MLGMALPADILAKQQDIEQAYRALSVNDPDCFIRGLMIPLVGQFQGCMAPFQRATFDDLVPSMRAVQLGQMPPKRRFWIERTKKASKDADIAAVLTWLLAFPKRPLYMQVGAANQEQAGIVRDRIKDLLFYNPWLQDFVEVQDTCVVHKGNGPAAKVDILTASIAGSHGATPDVMIVNELSHVQKWEFVENLLDNADGVPRGLVIVATNAGQIGSKSETWRRNALDTSGESRSHIQGGGQVQVIEKTNWTCHILSEPAPWHGKEMLADAKRRNPASRYKRLWQGKWTSGKGDALTEEGIDRCFKSNIKPLSKPEDGWLYVAGLDLGVSHDHSGLVIVGVQRALRRLRVAFYRAWEPLPGGEVNLSEVEEVCLGMSRLFRLVWFGYDPSQAVFMAQRLRQRGCPMTEMTFNGRNLDHMATAMVQAVEEGMLEIYSDGEDRLRRDLGKLTIVEKPYGYKLESVRDEFGHADVGTALAICLPRAVSLLSVFGLQASDDLGVDGELSVADADAMPDELKEIYGMDGKMDAPQHYEPTSGGGDADDLYGDSAGSGKGRKRVLGYDPDLIAG